MQSIQHLLHFSVKETMNGGCADLHLCSLNPSFRSGRTHQACVCEAKTSKSILNCLIGPWLTQMEKQFTSEITLADALQRRLFWAAKTGLGGKKSITLRIWEWEPPA